MNDNKLEEFGKEIMINVRDVSISNWEKIIDGKINAPFAKEIIKKVESFDEVQKNVLKWLIPQIIDENLSNFLDVLENSNNVTLLINNVKNTINVNELTDGLAGELYTEDGWISKFSKETKI